MAEHMIEVVVADGHTLHLPNTAGGFPAGSVVAVTAAQANEMIEAGVVRLAPINQPAITPVG